ncbi:MAG: ATP-binding protein [Kofleriaceae bacterium]
MPRPSAATAYLDALLSYDRAAARAIVQEALDHGDSLTTVYVDILQSALYQLGTRWEFGQITIAQEHYCTAATQGIMATLHGELYQSPRGGRRLLAVSVGGNLHSVGIRMVADVFELRGWSTVFTGADTAIESIVATLTREPFDVIAISAALSGHIAEIERLIVAVRALGVRTRILVGGRAFNGDPELWRTIGADGHAITPDQAVMLAESLVATTPIGPRLLELPTPEPHDPAGDERTLVALSEINTELHDMARALAGKNAELARVNAELNRMTGVIAHDLRNPLSVILHYAYFLREDLATIAPDQIEHLTSIDQAAEFMVRLLDDLLDVSRIRAGKLRLQPVELELVEFVRSVVGLNQHLAHHKSIELRVTTGAPQLVVVVDRDKIQQVINNLVGNAIQYSKPNTTIDIALATDGGTVTITVRDQGVGIAEADLPKVFLPFETVTSHGTAGEKSTGLGLAIVQTIVEAHRGSVRVESTLGVGTSFVVTLPIRVE